MWRAEATGATSVWRTEASRATSEATASRAAPEATTSRAARWRPRVGWSEPAMRAEGSTVEREPRRVPILRERGPGWTAADGGRWHLVANMLSVRPPP